MSKLEQLDREQLKQLDQESLIGVILILQRQMTEQQELIQQLQDQVAKDSHNSGKPPSSDGLKKGKRKSLRRSGQRPRGGQRGHKGRTLMQVAEPDHVIVHKLTDCPHCQTKLEAETVTRHEKRQVFDILPARIEVTEHQAEAKQCPGCGVCVKGEFPANVSQPTQYGLRLKALACYLYSQQFIPLARIRELLTALYGDAPSEPVVLAAARQLASRTQASLEQIRQQLVAAPVVHFDESGMRVAGQLRWLHVASTAKLTQYHVHDKRGHIGMRAGGILPHYKGVALHDYWRSYLKFSDCQHSFCNVHHLRDLAFIVEQYDQAWAAKMKRLLCDIKDEVAATSARHTTLPPDRLSYYEAAYDALIAQGFATNPATQKTRPRPIGRPKQAPPKNLLDRLHRHKAGVLAFMYDFRIPFDNNLVERDVRMIKVQQKVSGCFRTEDGAHIFCALRSYISTARKHGLNAIDAIYNAFLDQPFIPDNNQA
jgi:transposase